MSDLKGKVAIVTGASKGIGAGIAKGLAAAGAAVVVDYASSREGADRVVADIMAKGGKAIAVQGDVADAADVKRLFEQTKTSFGTLDVLVNNAGVYQFDPLEEVTEKEFHREFNTNVLGTLLTIQQALNYFGTGGGSIINISSIASLNPTPDSVVYSAQECGRFDHAQPGQRVRRAKNSRQRDRAGSHGIGRARERRPDRRRSRKAGHRHDAARPLRQPDDIAKVAVFLASDDSAWLTGERISASGGWR